ncbi:YphA family membrane protein [Ectobacillus ponti]|uniref:Uncharacterized protein n=1 Tax=Ectobacillus ponti TaxID=2961894 RepID=A0AA42BPH0_9BACI|nr:hypothetical protein [Ectobacillus ponti]MCP8968742.1 hypothetical protein [Ectobacillus ponti]
MEGSWFYLFAWSGWIVATFWMPKGALRLYTAIFILLLLSTAQLEIPFGRIAVAVPLLLLCAAGCLGMARLSFWRKLYMIIGSTVLAMLYAIFHLVELYDPVWIVLNQTWLLAACLAYASVLLFREHWPRVLVVLTGTVQGELLLTFILRPYGFRNTVGAVSSLDIAACAIALLCALHVLLQLFVHLEQAKQKQVRERQG